MTTHPVYGFKNLPALISCITGVAATVYAVVTLLGFASLPLPQQPIGQPYLTLMEVLILFSAPLMALTMLYLHRETKGRHRKQSRASLACMCIMAAITVSVHIAVLLVSNGLLPERAALFSFKWPSLVYVLDIIAWDIFFALSMLFSAITFEGNGLDKIIRRTMIVAGVLSIAGLAGVPTGNMQVRNIGIIGYGVLGPVIFFLVSAWFRRKHNSRA